MPGSSCGSNASPLPSGRRTDGADDALPQAPLQILIISAQFPYPATWGYATRVYQLARQVASRHDVTLLSYAELGDRVSVDHLRREFAVEAVVRTPPSVARKRIDQLRSLAAHRPFSARQVYSPEMQETIDRLCETRRFDLIQVETGLLCSFRIPPGTALVIDEHNIEYEVFDRMRQQERSPVRKTFNSIEHRRLRSFEQSWWRRADGCVVTSEREALIVGMHARTTAVEVVPNGVDLEYFSPSGRPAEPDTLLFNGHLHYRPNLDAAYYLVEEIWPRIEQRRPDAKLVIVGGVSEAHSRRLRRPNVTVTGRVPDLRPYLNRAAVVAVPIRMGGGTRLKVVEALAMGKPVVSTTLGCEGVGVRDGEHLVIADDVDGFASSVVTLMAEEGLRTKLGEAARALMEEQYSWDLAGRRIEDLYRRAVARRGHGVLPSSVHPVTTRSAVE